MFGSKKMEYRELLDVIKNTEGGIYKRIDENRELLQLLLEEHPDLLKNKPWIERWILATDNYLISLLRHTELPLSKPGDPQMPRPFPTTVRK